MGSSIKDVIKQLQDYQNLKDNSDIDAYRRYKAKNTINPKGEEVKAKDALKFAGKVALALGSLTPTKAAIAALAPSEVADDDIEQIKAFNERKKADSKLAEDKELSGGIPSEAIESKLSALSKLRERADKEIQNKLGVESEDDEDKPSWEELRKAYKEKVGRY